MTGPFSGKRQSETGIAGKTEAFNCFLVLFPQKKKKKVSLLGGREIPLLEKLINNETLCKWVFQEKLIFISNRREMELILWENGRK